MPRFELIPSAKRLISSLRDLGYDFSQAIADIVDNAIEANASVVRIDIEFNGDDSWVRIADNGRGMTPESLREALRYGADREYDDDDLGKFGLGMKTASLSQCECLSVASRWNRDRAVISGYSWDLSHIIHHNRWEIIPIDKNSLREFIVEPLAQTTGTVVFWEKLERVLGYKHPYGEAARKRLLATCREVESHLGMVFHRFLSGESRRKPLHIILNGNEIAPWDPFCRNETNTTKLKPATISINHEGIEGNIIIQPFALPHQDDFSTADAFRKASGPQNWNQQQGFYIYRAGRMIQSGGWSHFRSPDEHTKLARIAIDFSPGLDEIFKINVAKMRVQMPSLVKDQIRELIAPVIKLAREKYDKKSTSHSTSTPHSTAKLFAAQENQFGYQNSAHANADTEKNLYTLEQWSKKLLSVAKSKERPVIETAIKRLRKEVR